MGKGSYMKGRTAWNEEARTFLKTVPNIAVIPKCPPGESVLF